MPRAIDNGPDDVIDRLALGFGEESHMPEIDAQERHIRLARPLGTAQDGAIPAEHHDQLGAVGRVLISRDDHRSGEGEIIGIIGADAHLDPSLMQGCAHLRRDIAGVLPPRMDDQQDAALAARYNAFERLRDPTHTTALSPSALRALLARSGLVPDAPTPPLREFSVNLHGWMDATHTGPSARAEIVAAVETELNGTGGATGMRPHRAGADGGTLHFVHAWAVAIGHKRA